MFGLELIPLKVWYDFKPTESYDEQLQQSKWGIILGKSIEKPVKIAARSFADGESSKLAFVKVQKNLTFFYLLFHC